MARRTGEGSGAAEEHAEPVLTAMKVNPTEHPEWPADHFVLAVGHDEEVSGGRGAAKIVERLAARGVKPQFIRDFAVSPTG